MASLGNDLATIRKEQNLSLDDVNEATKIPKRILRSIEDDSIFTDFEENATYIRSYVRGYAKALSIDEKEIIHALNKREKNDYSGSLSIESDAAPDKSSEPDLGDDTSSSQDDDMIHDHAPEFTSGDGEDDPAEPESYGPPISDTAAKRSEVKSVDWADMGRQFQPLKSTNTKTWIGLVVLIIVVAGGVSYYFYNSGSSESATTQTTTTTQERTSSEVGTDSLQLNIVPSTDASTDDTTDLIEDAETSAELQNENLQTLPDTLTMVLYAAFGKLEPVRVYTDIMDNINPYWIEQGEAIRFNFVNEIRIRGQSRRMALIVNGHVVQNIREQFYNPETRLLEIDRSFFEQDPKWLQPSPDSLGIDAPPPTVIKERPTFN